MKTILFAINLIIHYVLLAGVVWSIAVPNKRIWPPPDKKSWKYRLSWALFTAAFCLNGLIIFLDWNSWNFEGIFRFFLGIPLVVAGSWLLMWGILTLGKKNTSGLKDGFIRTGPYQFTRNPQYLGDMLLFIGLILISNSIYLLIFNSLLILIFMLTPLAEEIWLEEKYGEKYLEYKQKNPRFF